MGTRGAVAWGTLHSWTGLYNHYDSYPDGLGEDVWTKVKEMGAEKFVAELSSHQSWKSFSNGGLCPYCGQRATPSNTNGLLFAFEHNLALRAGEQASEWARKSMEERADPATVLAYQKRRGEFWNKSNWCETAFGRHDSGYRDETISSLLVAYLYKETGFPDPHLFHHDHVKTRNSAPMTQDTADCLHIEWVYVVDTEANAIHVLCSGRAEKVRPGLQRIGAPREGNNSEYAHWHVDTVSLTEEEWPGSLIRDAYVPEKED